MSTRKLAWLLWPLLSGLACGSTSESIPPKQVVTEHRPLQAEKASKQLGEDCSTAGASECLSGTCFHYRPGLHDGYVCSQKCQAEESCPAGWSCLSIYPGEANRFCAPPQDFKPQATSARAAPSQPSSTDR